MPSIAERPLSPVNGKKRRRDDPSTLDVHMKLPMSTSASRSSSLDHMYTTTLNHIPRRAHLPDDETILDTAYEYRHEMKEEQRSMISKSRLRRHDSKRQRVEMLPLSAVEGGLFSPLQSPPPEAGHQHQTEKVERPVPQRTPSAVDLSSCHICHRKPTLRSELDAFADCESCGKRTCYICIRECLGAISGDDIAEESGMENGDRLASSFQAGGDVAVDGWTKMKPPNLDRTSELWELEKGKSLEHKGMVCSACCVERGSEGEVVCLGCLRKEEGG